MIKKEYSMPFVVFFKSASHFEVAAAAVLKTATGA